MRVHRFTTAVLFSLSVLTVPASAATTELRLLLDVDRNAATGCSVFGMSGIEQVVTTVLQQDEQGARVVATRRALCAGRVLGEAADIETNGWPASATSAGSVVESRIDFSHLGITRTQPVHAGFAVTSGNATTTIADQDGSPIVMPRPLDGRRRAASPASGDMRLTLDGQVADWNAIEPIAEGRGALQRVFIYAGASELYLRFELAAAALAVNPDTYVVRQGKILSIAAPGVLANDSAADGKQLTAAPGTPATHGTVAMTAEGGFTYVHDGTTVPVDTFDYRASDGSASGTATVTINVTPNARPVAAADSYDVAHRGSIDIPAPGVLGNDSDPEGDRLRASVVTAPVNGSLTLDSNGHFVYQHNGSDTRGDRFVYRASDGVSVASATVTIAIGANAAPIAVADAFTLNEGATLTVDAVNGLFANDSDTDTPRSFWSAIAVTQPVHGTLVLNANGSFTYTHDGGETTSDSFSYRTRDGIADSAVVTVSLTVTAVNDVPVAAADAYSIDEDAVLTLAAPGLLANDTDADLDTLTVVVVTQPSRGSVTLAPNGSFVYTPAPNANGSDSFTYRAADSSGATSSAMVTITIAPLNDPPSFTIAGDPASVNEDSGAQSVPSFAGAISAGPGESESVSFAVVSNSNPTLFSAEPAIDASGTLTYTAGANKNGSAVIVVRLVDSGASAAPHVNESATQQFTITINAVNDPPQYTAGAAVTVDEDSGAYSAVWAGSISPGPADEAAQSVSFTVTATNGALFSVAPALAADGTLTFTPAPHAFGTATITVSALDSAGGSTSPQMFPLQISPVNDPPGFVIASAPAAVSEDAGPQTVASFASAITAGPGESDSVAFVVVSNDLPALFSVAPAIDAAGALTYTAAANASGVATVTVKLTDDAGGESGTEQFTITVLAVNDPPAFSAPPSVTVVEDSGAYGAPFAAGIVAGPADESGQNVSFSIDSVTNAGLFASAPSIASDGTLSFTPAADAFGSAVVTFHASDDAGASTAPQSFTIHITAINDPPAFSIADPPAVAEDAGAQTVSALATGITPGALESDGVAFVITGNSNPSLFAAAPALDATGTLTYTAAADVSGMAVITVKLTDTAGGESLPQSFTIAVNAVNDPPSFTAPTTLTVNEDSAAYSAAFASAISAGPADESAQTVNFDVSNDDNTLFSVQPAIDAAGVLTFTPAANRFGSATVTITGTDSGGASTAPRTFTLSLASVNDAPSFTAGGNVTVAEDSGSYGAVQLTAISAGANESDSVTFSVSNDANALFSVQPAIDASGNLTFTPASEANGVATVSVIANDDGGNANGGVNASLPQTFTITLTAVNDAPVAGNDAFLVTEGGTLFQAAPGVKAGDSDVDGDAFNVSLVAGPAHASSFTLNADGSFSYVHDGTSTPVTDSFTYQLTDAPSGAISNTATVTLSITPVNDVPVALADAYVYPISGSLTVAAPGLLQNDTDEDNATLTAVLVSAPPAADGTLALSSDGSFTFVKNAPAGLDTTFTYRAYDGSSYSAPVTVTITFNSAPVAVADAYPTNEDVQLVVSAAGGLLTNDSDAENNISKVILVSGPTVGTFTTPAVAGDDALLDDGSFRYTPPADFNGSATFTYKLEDAGGSQSNTVTVTISIAAVNDAPQFTPGAATITVNEDSATQNIAWATAIRKGPVTATDEATQTLTFVAAPSSTTLLQNGTTDCVYDPVANPSDPISCTATTKPVVLDPSTGMVTFRPAANQYGTTTVAVYLKDNGGTANGGIDRTPAAPAVATFNIVVNPVNDPPTLTRGANLVIPVNAAVTAHSFPGWATNITAGPNETDQVLTLTVTASNPSLFTVQPAIDKATGNLTFTTAANASGVSDIIANLSDNGSPSSFLNQQFTNAIFLGNKNDAPSFTSGGNITVNEDSGAQTINNWATNISQGGDDTGQIVSFTVLYAPTSLFSVAPAVQASNSATPGRLTFTPAANQFGTATLNITAKDNGGTAGGGSDSSVSEIITITINPVNDPPDFTASNVGVPSSASTPTAYSLPNWVGNISFTPDPAGQAINSRVVTVTSGANLFNAGGQPAIDASNTLTFTTAVGQTGVAAVNVILTDDGGTPGDPADDVSRTKPYTIGVGVNSPPSFTAGSNVVVVEDSGASSFSGWATNISSGYAGEAPQTVSFIATVTSGSSLFSVAPAISASGVLTFTTAANQSGVANVSVVARDNGGTAGGGVDTSAAQILTITISAVNDAPLFTIPAYAPPVAMNVAAQTVTSFASGLSAGPNETGQTPWTFVVDSNSNSALFMTQPAINGTNGNLTYRPATGATGFADIGVKMRDSGGTASGGVDTSVVKFFRINVGNVNLAPTFTKGANQTVDEDAAPVTVSNWATGISAGPGETTQSVTQFLVSCTNPTFFSAGPAISAAGTLTYTVAANQSGVSTCTVTAKDDGGTANGGVDTSAAQTFTITINPINDPPTFSITASDTVLESPNPSPRLRSNFATSIAQGPNETGQTLTFEIVSNSNSALFTTQPALTVSGSAATLTYTQKANVFGTATITVRLKDNGSSVAPHSNTSATATFDIIISELNDPPAATNKAISTYSGIEVTIRNVDTGYRLLDGATDPNGTTAFTVGTISNLQTGARVTIIDAATGAFKYDPAPGTGTQTFNYTICDTGLGAQGARCSAAATVTVSVGGSSVLFASPTGSGSTCSYTNPCSYAGIVAMNGGWPSVREPNGTVIFLSGTYTLNAQADGPSVWLRPGEKVIGQGAGGNYDTTYGIGSIPVGVLAARPNLASGTRPVINKASGNAVFVMDTTSTSITYFDLNHSSNTAISTFGDDLTGSTIDRVKMGGGFSMYSGTTGLPAPAQGLSIVNSQIIGGVYLGTDRGPVTITNTPITVPAANDFNSSFQIFNNRKSISFVNSPISITTTNAYQYGFQAISATDVSFDAASTVTLSNARMFMNSVANFTFNGRVNISWTNPTTDHYLGGISINDGRGIKMLASNNTVSVVGSAAMNLQSLTGTSNELRFQTLNVTRGAIPASETIMAVTVQGARGPVTVGTINRTGTNILCVPDWDTSSSSITTPCGSIP